MLTSVFSVILGTLSTLSVVAARIDDTAFLPNDVIDRDVVIIGGGAAGAHAAVKLRQDFNKSVVVIEKEAILVRTSGPHASNSMACANYYFLLLQGGHVDTYLDIETGRILDYGVQVYFPYDDAMDFFKRFNVTIAPFNPRSGNSIRYVDFSTGQELTTFQAPDALKGLQAIRKFHDLTIEKGYDKMTQPGYWNLPKGDKIPDDLLLPIGQMVKKYDIEPMLAMLYPSTGGDAASRSGGFENLLTLTLMKAFPTAWAKAYLGDVPMYRVEGGNQGFYDQIGAFLGSNVLYSSMVAEAERTDSGVKLRVRSKDGKTEKLVTAKKLLVAVPPSRENLAPLDLDAVEKSLFAKPKYGRSHTAIARHPLMPKNVTLRNMPSSASVTPLSPFLKPPFVMSFQHYGGPSNLYMLGASGSDFGGFDDAAAQGVARDAVRTMAGSGLANTTSILGAGVKAEDLEFVAWSDHGEGGYGVSSQEMRDGWMDDFYGLQGKKSTWFTGGAVATDFTTVLWKFNDQLLPMIVKGM